MNPHIFLSRRIYDGEKKLLQYFSWITPTPCIHFEHVLILCSLFHQLLQMRCFLECGERVGDLRTCTGDDGGIELIGYGHTRFWVSSEQYSQMFSERCSCLYVVKLCNGWRCIPINSWTTAKQIKLWTSCITQWQSYWGAGGALGPPNL